MFALKPAAIDAHLNWIRDQESIIDCETKKDGDSILQSSGSCEEVIHLKPIQTKWMLCKYVVERASAISISSDNDSLFLTTTVFERSQRSHA
jgi:hypothetical protein